MSFIQFGTDDSVISSEVITAPAWSGYSYTITSSYTSSIQQVSSVSGKFYLNVFNIPYDASGSEVQFAIAYGHISGSGSLLFNNTVDEKSPTRDVYGQYRNLVYGDENSLFNFGGSNGISRDIFVVNVNRTRYKESINPGTWGLTLSSSGYTINLTDDSKDSSITNFIGGNRVYNIVSGSLGHSYNSSSIQTNSGSYGLFFPDMGIFVFNPRALSLGYSDKGISFTVNETAASTYSYGYNINNATFYKSIADAQSFSARSQETISARYFFVTAKSSQLNYTSNPSIIDNNGNILFSTLIDNPKVYPTTIGLYNDTGELLAVAKLSKPLPKDFTKQINCRVKIEF
jgi:hypothetical protein